MLMEPRTVPIRNASSNEPSAESGSDDFGLVITPHSQSNLSWALQGQVLGPTSPTRSGLPSPVSEHSNDPEFPPAKRIKRIFSHVQVNEPEFPRSAFEGWLPPLPTSSERDAILELKTRLSTRSATEHIYFELDNFSVYRPSEGNHSSELCSLDRLQNRRSYDELLFDGILSVGAGPRYYVQAVPFKTVTIDGYGDPHLRDMRDYICIQSPTARGEEVWYRLGQPAVEYRRFFAPFLYLAQFAKHFVNYLLDQADVALHDFRRNFYAWLFVRYSGQPMFTSWLAECNHLRDFRTTVSAHVDFLWKECYGIDDQETRLTKHTIWIEADPRQLKAIPAQPLIEKRTVVTAFVYECFRRSYFAEHLEPRFISDGRILRAVSRRKMALGILPLESSLESGLHTPTSMRRSPSQSAPLSISIGDVVCVPPDEESHWRTTASFWYAYVQAVRVVNGLAMLDVLWLYEPADTTLGNAYYPFSNELFLSDNCSCGVAAIDASCVISKTDVIWGVVDPAMCSDSGFFVRQKFRTIHQDDTYDFVTLRKADFRCACHLEDRHASSAFNECRQNYALGDNVLFLEYNNQLNGNRLEPAQITDFLLDLRQVVLRRFKRRSETDSRAPLNEITLSQELFRCPPSKIVRRCHVRIFHSDVVKEGLPPPYNADGAGDFFYIIEDSEHMQDGDTADKLLPVEEGWDPQGMPPKPKMRGMGIFCGGGNLDRGLADGGAVEFKYAIDYAEHALHTYRANAEDEVQFFLGSVDDYLAQAMASSQIAAIAQPGSVEVLAAGSPCPGFSRANTRRNDPQALRNASMVASVISYVDFYSPKYCILENVVPMTQGMGVNKDENVFAQILAALVAMGYQAQQFLMEAWCFGSSQGRTRVFIVASAPGLEPFRTPPHTHSHPQTGRKPRTKSLGTSNNGLRFGLCRDDYTPFEHISPLEATSDLPDVGDSLPQLCPPFPDHRVPVEDGNVGRSCMAVVPMYPRGMGLVQAIKCSPLTGSPLKFYEAKLKHNPTRSKDDSKVYARVDPDLLFPTFLTKLPTTDGIMGPNVHWSQPRSLTIMEARRGQGFLDAEVIIGSPAQQMRIIGNSVDRKVALALGLALRKSWLGAGQADSTNR